MVQLKTRWFVVFLAALAASASGVGQAQDMKFALDEVDPDAARSPPGGSAPPSSAWSQAMRDYSRGDYSPAAAQLQRVVQGDTQDSPSTVQSAQFALGKALFHLGLPHASLVMFDEIAHTPGHAERRAILPWLAQLAQQLQGAPAVAQAVEQLGMHSLADVPHPDDRALWDPLRFALAKSLYARHELDGALALLDELRPGSSHYLRGRLLAGIIHVRDHKAKPAVAAFRAAIDGSRADDAGEPDAGRLRNLAWMSLGRLYYSTGFSAREPERQGALMGNAVDAWNHIEPSSDYWPTALFESSWALFVTDQHSRALGNVHSLMSPFLRHTFHPEALVLKAVILYRSCQMDQAVRVIRQFEQRYAQQQAMLDRATSQPPDAQTAFRWLDAVQRGLPDAEPALAPALSDRELAGVHRAVLAVRGEREHLASLPTEFRQADVGQRVAQDLQLAESVAMEAAAEAVRDRLARLREELQELNNQMATVEIEILNALRQGLQHPPGPAVPAAGREVRVDAEHVVWPFEGEYWRDELGYYRQEISDACPAR